MSIIHRFMGEWGVSFRWDGARTRQYTGGASSGATETWLIGKAEQAGNFALRYYELEPGGFSREEAHSYDHGIIFMAGSGTVSLSGSQHPVTQGDVVYIASDEPHQIRNTGITPLGWLCIIPARRLKSGHMVWAEEGLEDTLTTTTHHEIGPT